MAGFAVVCALASAAAVTAWLLHFRVLRSMLDIPNHRSLHSIPTPRSGGLAILVGILVGVTIYRPTVDELQVLVIGLALAVIVAVSMLDDMYGTSILLRLSAHFLGAVILLVGGFISYLSLAGIDSVPDILRWLGALSFLVWMTNMYNFMDGMDGFAGGMAVIGFGALGYLAWMSNSSPLMILSFIVAASATGFLFFNLPPARIFMGDTGSSVLGFVAGAFILWAHYLDVFPVWIGLLVFSPFIVDATLTLIRRLLSGERIWTPHKTHYYQRLVQLGWGHRKTALLEYGAMLVSAIAAILVFKSTLLIQWLTIMFFVGFYFVAAVIIETVERRA